MDNIVYIDDYRHSCKNCANLLRVGKGRYKCLAREFPDGASVYPVEDGKRTAVWNVCDGENFEKMKTKKSDERKSI